MPIFAFGINYKTAPIEIREQAVFDSHSATSALQALMQIEPVNEAMILSTCNRTELYAAVGPDQDAGPLLKAWLVSSLGLQDSFLDPHLYCRNGKSAVQHIMRVASGLDSMVLGEPQILGQMKEAFALAQHIGTIGPKLGRLLPAVFTVTKQVRTDTAIGANPVSLAYAALRLAKRVFTHTHTCNVLCIGSGDMARLVALYLYEQGVKKIVLVGRTPAKMKDFAKRVDAHCVTFRDIPNYLQDVDIVVSATASQIPILGKGAVESALKGRGNRPMVMFDLAVPRDIEAEISALSDTYLYNIDDLQEIVKQGYKVRKQAATQAEAIINVKASSFMAELKALDAVKVIRDYRQYAENMRKLVLGKAYKEMAQGILPETVLEKMSQQLVNKLLHKPTVQLRQLAHRGEFEAVHVLKDIYKV